MYLRELQLHSWAYDTHRMAGRTASEKRQTEEWLVKWTNRPTPEHYDKPRPTRDEDDSDDDYDEESTGPSE